MDDLSIASKRPSQDDFGCGRPRGRSECANSPSIPSWVGFILIFLVLFILFNFMRKHHSHFRLLFFLLNDITTWHDFDDTLWSLCFVFAFLYIYTWQSIMLAKASWVSSDFLSSATILSFNGGKGVYSGSQYHVIVTTKGGCHNNWAHPEEYQGWR